MPRRYTITHADATGPCAASRYAHRNRRPPSRAHGAPGACDVREGRAAHAPARARRGRAARQSGRGDRDRAAAQRARHAVRATRRGHRPLGRGVVVAGGGVVELGSPGGEPWGPDLVGLFVGSEGNFGVATRITVRLLPVARAVRTLLADFTSLRTAGEAVSAVIASGIVPAALEMMDQSCIQAVEDSVYAAGYPRDAAAVLLAELDGAHEAAVAADAETIQAVLRAHGARSVLVAADAQQREKLWLGRKKAFGAMGRLSRDLVVQDAVVP